MPLAGVPLDVLVWAFVVEGELLPPHAAMIAVAMPAAPPVRAVRRVTARFLVSGVCSCFDSAHSRRSSASLTKSDSWSGTSGSLPDGSASMRVGRSHETPPIALSSGGDCSRSHLACQARARPRTGRPLEEGARSTGSGMRKNAGRAGCAWRRPVQRSTPPVGLTSLASVNANRDDTLDRAWPRVHTAHPATHG